MLVRDVMTPNPVTVNSSAPLVEIKRIMDSNKIRRVPVVDGVKLVGIVTRNSLEREVSSMISTLTAADVMVRHLVTVHGDATVEEAVGTAQAKRVGALLVVQRKRLVGIATTNDFFYKILNPLLGIALPGSRISVRNCGTAAEVEKVLHVINGLKLEVSRMFTMKLPGNGEQVFTAHLANDDPSDLIAALTRKGFVVEPRKR